MISLSIFHQSVHPSISPSTSPSIYQSIDQPIHLSIHLSIYLSIVLSIFLPPFLPSIHPCIHHPSSLSLQGSGPLSKLWEYRDDRTAPHSPVTHGLVGIPDTGAILTVTWAEYGVGRAPRVWEHIVLFGDTRIASGKKFPPSQSCLSIVYTLPDDIKKHGDCCVFFFCWCCLLNIFYWHVAYI